MSRQTFSGSSLPRVSSCVPCALGGTEDHLHLLTRLHPSTPVARLVAEVKGASSHLVTHRLAPAGLEPPQEAWCSFSPRLQPGAPEGNNLQATPEIHRPTTHS
ncbi:MAG: hypothetical protein E6J78_00350 [Deltaproteobacteria bacterium]|nr:MAG: hypothetical protein E6J78_00350 [Deltaproteobacteria bacterium]